MDNKQPTRGVRNDTQDLRDSAHDRQRMMPEETTIDMPEVKDIPGQEHIHPPRIREMEDVTISSDDEEGKGVLDVLDNPSDEDITGTSDSNVSATETQLLAAAADTMPTNDQYALQQAMVDQQDDDGDTLNEEIDQSGSDLDVPGSEDDDANEEIGEEDEENNLYSQSDQQDKD